MNKSNHKQLQYTQTLEQEQLVGYWVKRFGISKRDLESHPQIDEVIFLLKFKEEFKDMNNYRQKQYDRIWNWCYKGQYPLKAKHLNQLAASAEHTIRKRNRQNQQRQHIKALR